MLDLPELHGKVFQHLGRHDLTQCAQVNRQWHARTIPHIWRDLTCVNSYNARRETFRRIVLEDYLQENGYEEGPRQPSALSKYGHLIRLLPGLRDLENTLQSQAYPQQGNEPTAHDLILHLFKYSSKAQVKSLSYHPLVLESDKMKSILAFALPRLRSLDIRAYFKNTQSEFIEFKSVLDQCSTTLESLDVNICVRRAVEAVNMEDEATENESICWTSLKSLTLRHDPDVLDIGPFLVWMWKRCGQVERLHVRMIDKSTPSLVQAMSVYMHNLEEITIGEMTYTDWGRNLHGKMKGDVVAALLSGSRQGWRSVSVRSTAELGRETMNVLAMHYSTLEVLHVDGSKDLPSCDLVQILRSCPHLHTLCYTNLTYGNSAVSSQVFIDLDPDTGLLKPWLCERSLRVLQVKLFGIPRPDLEGQSTLLEAYPGRGREIQSQVYDRIGRLTNLEALKLGEITRLYPHGCLEMSLESGLEKLSGLKSLEELSVVGLATKIGDKEIQWMAENWPKLRVIYGVYGGGKDWRR